MADICILTDSAAQFTDTSFAGADCVHVLSWRGRTVQDDPLTMPLSSLPVSLPHGAGGLCLPPSRDDFLRTLAELSQRYAEIVLLLTSSHFAPVVEHAQSALQSARCPAAVYLIDSQNISVGLGMLVQSAAQAADQGCNGAAVAQHIRSMLPRIYALFCLPDLTYLAQSKHITLSQALVGESLKLMPIFVMEGGRLVPIQKARTTRHLLETFFEYIAEFDYLAHLALLFGLPPLDREGGFLRDRVIHNLSVPSLSEHVFNASAASVLGPRGMGVAILEDLGNMK